MRPDYAFIASYITPGAQVLDLGCGDGELLSILAREKQAQVQGIEVDEQAIHRCVEQGVSALHNDIDSGLPHYPDQSFDYIIINQSMQQVRHVDLVITDALRVAREVIIGFPNFAYYKARLMLISGRAPITQPLPYEWHNTPNLRFLSIADFERYCAQRNLIVKRRFYSTGHRSISVLPNLRAEQAIFVLGK